jgi:hypothetical protein
MNNINSIILEILKEIEDKENNLKISGGRGYGAGKAYPNKTVSVLRMLGKEEGTEQENYVLRPVAVSKVFKERKK